MVGSILLYILYTLLALLVLALILPAVLYVAYENGEFSLKVRVLFVKLTVLPPKPAKKEKKPKKEKPKEPTAPEEGKEPEKKKKKRSIESWIRLIKRIASAATRGLAFLLRNIYIRDISLVLPVYAADAADTALNVGKIQMLVGATRAVLQNLLHTHYKRLVIMADYTGQLQQAVSFSCKILVSPVIIVAMAIVALKRFLLYGRRRRRKAARKKAPPTGLPVPAQPSGQPPL